jgi:hypothetical protein
MKRQLALWVLLASICGAGCSGGYDKPVPGEVSPPAPESGDIGSAEAAPSAAQTDWQLLDDTPLEVAIDPPSPSADTEVALRAERRGDGAIHAPLKSLHYRVVPQQDAPGEWIPFPEAAKSELAGGMFRTVYKASTTLPKGEVFVQFKVDHGFGEPYELKDWSIRVQ